jgi:hypothetical protein
MAVAGPMQTGGAPPFVAPDLPSLKQGAADSEVESELGGYVVVLPAPYAAPAVAVDPRFHWRFARAIYIYAPDRSAMVIGSPQVAAGLTRLVTVHHQPEDTPRAQQTARLIARLLRLYRTHFHRDAPFPRDADTADVWLTPDTPPNAQEAGGETRDNQVYIFATDAARSPIEWTRTVSHEWGHLTMYAARGFLSPENDAGGFLGERLYLKWMREEPRTGAPADDGVTQDGLDLYWDRQIEPLMDLFADAGPTSPKLDGLDDEAMDLYIGGVLAADAAFGSALTGEALRSIEGVRSRDFFDSLRQTVSDRLADSALPVRLPAWVPLERGRYLVSDHDHGGAAGIPLRLSAPEWRFLRTPEQAMLRRMTTGSAAIHSEDRPRRETNAG